jgi:lipopolysaccharide export LptBFGC system permease protein LptF
MDRLSAPLLIVAAALLAGSVGLAESDNGNDRAMLAGAGVGAGMVVLGAYLSGSGKDQDSDS